MTLRIQILLFQMENYFRYFPTPPELLKWGLALSACGFTRVHPHSSYPPAQHPDDHALDWSHGRVIEALQIVLVSEGGGCLETRETRQQRIETGMVFLLLPNTWHRYRPDPETGWVESWIELRGPVVADLLQNGVFTAESILKRGGIEAGIEETLNRIHLRAGDDIPGSAPELAALGMQVLAQFSGIAAKGSRLSNTDRAVHRAERYLNDHFREPVQIEDLAVKLGVAYSHFRRAFRSRTGFTPWKYVVHLRLTRARALMASSDATLDDIASQTGLSSGFHLSSAFKQSYGISPSLWKKTLMSKNAGNR